MHCTKENGRGQTAPTRFIILNPSLETRLFARLTFVPERNSLQRLRQNGDGSVAGGRQRFVECAEQARTRFPARPDRAGYRRRAEKEWSVRRKPSLTAEAEAPSRPAAEESSATARSRSFLPRRLQAKRLGPISEKRKRGSGANRSPALRQVEADTQFFEKQKLETNEELSRNGRLAEVIEDGEKRFVKCRMRIALGQQTQMRPQRLERIDGDGAFHELARRSIRAARPETCPTVIDPGTPNEIDLVARLQNRTLTARRPPWTRPR